MKILFVVALLLAVVTIFQTSYAAEGHEILFRSSGSQLSKSDKKQIFRQLKTRLSKDGKSFVDETCDKGYMLEAEVVDLNKDGIPEVFVLGGDTCTSGITGSSIRLFVKDSAGKYRMNLDFPAAAYEILPTANKGFPDLKFGGAGFCRGVWQWDGRAYNFLRNEPAAKGGCDEIEKMKRAH